MFWNRRHISASESRWSAVPRPLILMKSHFYLCRCRIHTEDINCAGACGTRPRLIQRATLNVIWRQRAELMKALRAPGTVAELVTAKHLSSHTAALMQMFCCVCALNVGIISEKECNYAVNQSINQLLRSSCKSLPLPDLLSMLWLRWTLLFVPPV